MRRTCLVIAIAALGSASRAHAAPGTMHFAGRLADASGPVDGNISISFAIFDTATGGTSVWSESQPVVAAKAGLVTTELGAVTPLDPSVFTGGTEYLEITVNGTVLAPRLALDSVPYALHADVADQVGSYKAGDLQARVAATCAPGSAIRAIDGAGGVTCDPAPVYTGGAGVAVNGTSVGLDPTGCSAGSVWKWSGTGWSCLPDANTVYTGGAGIDVNGSTVALSSTGCGPGDVWKWSGTAWACQPDADTTYTQGSGIAITSTTIATDNTVVARKDAAAGNQTFNGGTLFLDYANGLVGIKTTTPQVALDVAGEVRAVDYKYYPSPQFRYWDVAGDAFRGDGVWNIGAGDGGYGYLAAGTNRNLVVPFVADPRGDVLNQLFCVVWDGDAANDISATVTLTQTYTQNPIFTKTTLATLPITTTGSSPNTHLLSVSLSATINPSYSYDLHVSWNETPANGGTNLRFYGCELVYSSAYAD